ncbi:universal stress protein [Shimia thalassica]|uniref:universal stress protein n=1 Tax=Shimia thalassica TaxID=1715693 RepID=UPI0026E11EAE|nr:universal stress protein [Shimia thalassica]MDO6483205.1 universal stress protein [Shimia thalassica]
MYKKILVPVSFDDDRNIEDALSIAKRLGDEDSLIVLLHVMEFLPSYAINYIPEGFNDEAKLAITGSLSELAVGLTNATVEVVEGHSGRTILDWADENAVDCIVIASHRPGMQDYFLGSTAAQVVRHAKCAVHVVR